MVIDYKGVTFSFKEKRRKQWLRKIRIFFLILLLVGIYLVVRNFLDAGKVKAIQELLLSNKYGEAAEKLENTGGSFFHKDTKKELKALMLLADGNRTSAANAKAVLESVHSANSLVDYQKFLDFFSSHGLYRELKIYTDHLLKVKRPPHETDLLFYKAMYNAAMFDYNGSLTAIGQMPAADKEKHKQELAIIEKIVNEMKTGKLTYIFDMNGQPMAYYDLQKGQTVSLTPGMSFEAFDSNDPSIKDNLRFFSFTIDRAIQDKVHAIFKRNNYHGSLLLINLNDGSIAAAYSNSLEATGNSVFSELYEPGSIIKLITLFAYLQSNGQDIFPLKCAGLCHFNKKTFYDWIKHDEIKDYEKALVVSCNICFARMGIQLGAPKMTSVLNSFYFNKDNKNALKDRYFDFKTGTFNQAAADDSQLANLSVGLNEIAVTTFHSALIPAIIAQNGTIYSPHLIKNEKNLLNLAYYNHASQLLTVATDTGTFTKLKDAMIRVVEDEDGTGKRARVNFVKVALKTGTAGKRALGLDAIMSGFFPTEKPQYAFGFRLQGVGKAEFKGGLFLREFLISFYGEK